MTAKPATVRSVMRIYYTAKKPTIIPKASCAGEYLLYSDKDGRSVTELRFNNSAPVEFVRWPEKTK
jgi:hypothetical protein